MSAYSNKSFLGFKLKDEYKEPPLFVFLSLILKHKVDFIWVSWHFWHMRHITKVSCIFKIKMLSIMTPTLFARILGDSIYLSKFVLLSICKKCRSTQIKAFLCFKIMGGWKSCNHKTAFIWVPWHFCHMLDKTKVSCLVKTHILSFMTPSLFARFLRYTLYISFKLRKKGRGHNKIEMCIFTIRETFVLSSICQKCQGSE